MAAALCRLCYEVKPATVDIFSEKGFLLGIASAIRMHLMDEVNADDIFPKFVCSTCWFKLREFDLFYMSVEEAKNNFLMVKVKEEVSSDANEMNLVDDVKNTENIEVKTEPVECEVSISVDEYDDPTENMESNGDSPLLGDTQVEGEEEEIHESVEHEFEAENDENEFEGENDENEPQNTATDETNQLENVKVIEEDHQFVTKKLIITSRDDPEKTAVVSDNGPKLTSMTCEKCDFPVRKISELIKHYSENHDGESIQMKCCGTRLRVNELLDHLEFHKNPEQYRCSKCSNYFPLKSLLHRHQRNLSCTRPSQRFNVPVRRSDIQCSICPSRLRTLSEAMKHYKHEHKKMISAVRCCSTRISIQDWRDHVEYHNNPAKYRCKKCEKSFKLTIDLDNHNCSAEVPAPPKPPTPKPPQPPLKVEFSLHPKTMRQMAVTKAINDQMKKIEKSSKSFRCPKCPKLSFNSMALLTAHIRATHNFAEHQCRICGNDYVTAGRLKEHMVKHTGEYLFKCEFCQKAFKFNSGIIRHYKTDHPREWPSMGRRRCNRYR